MAGMKEPLTHEQALRRLHDHLGEEVDVGLEVRDGGGGSEVIGLHGKLRHPYSDMSDAPVPDDVRERWDSFYTVGGQEVRLSPLSGTITESANGLDFELTAEIVLRIGWNAAERRVAR